MEIVIAIIVGAGILITALAHFFPRTSKKQRANSERAHPSPQQGEEQEAVYEGTRAFLTGIERDGTVDNSELQKFTIQIMDAGLLFGDEMHEYLFGLRSKAIEAKRKHDQQRFQEHADLIVELVYELEKDRMYEKFRPFMQLDLPK